MIDPTFEDMVKLKAAWDRDIAEWKAKVARVEAERDEARLIYGNERDSHDVTEAQVAALREALEPFAQHYTDHELTSQSWGNTELLPYVARDGLRRWLRSEDFLRARAVLAGSAETAHLQSTPANRQRLAEATAELGEKSAPPDFGDVAFAAFEKVTGVSLDAMEAGTQQFYINFAVEVAAVLSSSTAKSSVEAPSAALDGDGRARLIEASMRVREAILTNDDTAETVTVRLDDLTAIFEFAGDVFEAIGAEARSEQPALLERVAKSALDISTYAEHDFDCAQRTGDACACGYTKASREVQDACEDVLRVLPTPPKAEADHEWECPIQQPGCVRNCGSYGCGN